jgi:hypothetical protein
MIRMFARFSRYRAARSVAPRSNRRTWQGDGLLRTLRASAPFQKALAARSERLCPPTRPDPPPDPVGGQPPPSEDPDPHWAQHVRSMRSGLWTDEQEQS